MNYYFLLIEREAVTMQASEIFAYTYDDLDGVTASAKRALKRLPETGQLTLRLIETEGLGPNGEDKRTVTEFTGDADIVATVLKKKLATERKSVSETPAPASQDETVTA